MIEDLIQNEKQYALLAGKKGLTNEPLAEICFDFPSSQGLVHVDMRSTIPDIPEYYLETLQADCTLDGEKIDSLVNVLSKDELAILNIAIQEECGNIRSLIESMRLTLANETKTR